VALIGVKQCGASGLVEVPQLDNCGCLTFAVDRGTVVLQPAREPDRLGFPVPGDMRVQEQG